MLWIFHQKKARSKLPKKRRRVLPVEQPRRKRGNEAGVTNVLNRRMTLPKPPHPANAIFKDAFGSAKIGKRLNLEWNTSDFNPRIKIWGEKAQQHESFQRSFHDQNFTKVYIRNIWTALVWHWNWSISLIPSGHLNGVNVIGLSLQQTVPAISAPGLRPPLINQPMGDFSSLQMHLQPRRPTTGNVDFLLPLQPELLLGNLWRPVT